MLGTPFLARRVDRGLCPAIAAVAALLASAVSYSQASATWSPDYANAPPEYIAWFNNAQTTSEARARLGWQKCCDHSDRFKTKFLAGKTSDEWYFEQDGEWKRIPPDVIHQESDPTMPQQLKTEGVLFIFPPVSGQPTCFWPPEGGI